jgi:hypothetical protein
MYSANRANTSGAIHNLGPETFPGAATLSSSAKVATMITPQLKFQKIVMLTRRQSPGSRNRDAVHTRLT